MNTFNHFDHTESFTEGTWGVTVVFTRARYAKGQVAVRVKHGSSFKLRPDRLAGHVVCRYSHREFAYIMNPAKARKLYELIRDGRDASPITGELRPVDQPLVTKNTVVRPLNVVRRVGDARPLDTRGCISIDDAIAILSEAKKHSPLGGDTCLAWCGIGSESGDLTVCDMKLEIDGTCATMVVYTDGPVPSYEPAQP